MEAQGRVIAVMPVKSGVSQRSGNTWMSAEYVIEIPGQYVKKMMFTVFGEDKIQKFAIRVGEDITVHFDIDAHEYNGRWFNEVRAYNVVRGSGQQSVSQSQPQQQPQNSVGTGGNPYVRDAQVIDANQQQQQPEGKADDLPF